MNRIIVILIFFVILIQSAHSSDNEKREILNSMEFPAIPFKAGLALNDPLFAVNISRKNMDLSSVKSRIINIEGMTGLKEASDIYYELGNLYHSIADFEKSSFYFDKYLQIKSGFLSDTTDKKLYQTTGDIYFTLSKTVSGEFKNDYLENSLYYFSKALEFDKVNIDCLEKIGDCLLYLSRFDESISYYKKIQELDQKNPAILFKLQAAAFQKFYSDFNRDHADSKSHQFNYKDYRFDYLEKAEDIVLKEFNYSIFIQKQVYLLRLILYDYIRNKNGMINGSDDLITHIEFNFKKIDKNVININDLKYVNSIISFLKKDFKSSLSYLNELLICNDPVYCFVESEILNIYIKSPLSTDAKIKYITDSISLNPTYDKYFSLARFEFIAGNIERAEKLCIKAIKSEKNCAECYSALSIIYAHKGNYFAAEHMIKKGNSLLKKNPQSYRLSDGMKVNEAAIALLKNERERAYILLRSVLSLDDNENGLLLYNRYFNKK